MRLRVALQMPLCVKNSILKKIIMNKSLPEHYISRFFKEPEESFFLFGPRGTGKSTLLKKRFSNAYWIDLLLPEVQRSYEAFPERLYQVVKALPVGATVIIDEIQKIPTLLTVVHKLIEEHKRWRFILTGSSARKLKREGVDLLAGRAIMKTLHPFMATELKEAFSLEEALEYGMIPIRFNRKDPKAVLNTYIHLYLQEEVRQEGFVRNYEDFARFLETMTFSHGAILNLQNISQECSVKRKTVENYISILEDLLLGFRLQIFTKRAKRELSAHPKFYFFDTGVFKILRPKSVLDIPEEINGSTLEGLVAQHLLAWKDYTDEKHQIFLWRTRSGVEVDFIVYGPWGIWAIEVKNGTKISKKDLKGLKAFMEDYPTTKSIILYRGKEPLKIDGILCLSCEDFLKSLYPNHPIC